MRTNVLSILKGMKSFLGQALDNREKYVNKANAFSRERKLPFSSICLFLVNQPKRSLSIELDDFFQTLGKYPCTKAAFSKARYQIAPCFFKDWNNHFMSLVYSFPRSLLTWKGFYLKGVDGTTIYLFRDKNLSREFGVQKNQYGAIPMARAGLEVDLLNGYCTAAYLGPISKGEHDFAEEFLNNSHPLDLRVYDRYYPSFELIFKHLQNKVPFVMRCAIDFNQTVKNFAGSNKRQVVVDFPISHTALTSLKKQGYEVDEHTTVTVRLLRIDIGSSEPEILITSLLDAKRYPHSCFKTLYAHRWGSETQFDKIKNKMQVEIFSGHKPLAIYQDFLATVLALNLHNLIVRDCDGEVEKINQERIIPAAINQNISLGLLKARIIILFDSETPRVIYKELKRLFLSHLEPVRPGRKFPRVTPARRLNGKYQTFKNYRRSW